MDFALSEEQQLLAESLRRFLEEECPVTTIRDLVVEHHGHDGGNWKALAELGVAGLLVPEEYGGSGLGMLDAVVAAEILGWGVAPGPFLATAVLAPMALLHGGSSEQQARWLPAIATGTSRIGAARNELVSMRDDAGVESRDGCLYGRSLMVIDAEDADHFLVCADGGRSLALVDAAASGLTRVALKTIDRTRGFAELELDGVEPVEWIGEAGSAEEVCQRVLDAGRIILAADILGASGRALEKAVAYAMERKQFERVIGSFQAVKHMCAEMVAELEPARSLVWYAGHAFDELPGESSTMACHAKSHLSEVGPFIVRTATEVHGGIGFTDEQNLHYWFKRVGVDRQLLGSPEAVRAEAARAQGWID
ncbi:MAG: acyl-CoA dehydrogenase family protein [Myxococcota bacterium]|nr:acyl-CoA dehydrogenase family protein [Myxococcota bacterium]